MQLNKRFIISLCVAAITVYAVIHYWNAGEGIIQTLAAAVAPFVFGAMIAYVVNILMSGYERVYRRLFRGNKFQKFSRPFSLVLAYSTFVILLLFLLGTVIPELVSSIQSLVEKAPEVGNNLIDELQENKWINQMLTKYYGSDAETEITNRVTDYLSQALTSLGGILLGLLTSVTGIFSTLLNIFMSLIFSIYVLGSKEILGNQVRRLIKGYLPKWYAGFENVREIFHDSFKSFFIGQTTEAIILGCLTFIGMLLLKFPYASTVSILVGFSAMIPVMGAYIGVTVGVILIMTESFEQSLAFLLFIVILQQLEGNLIYPRVVGNSVGLPGMWVIVAITMGGALGGIFGMLVAVPFFAACYKLIRQDVERREALRVKEKEAGAQL